MGDSAVNDFFARKDKKKTVVKRPGTNAAPRATDAGDSTSESAAARPAATTNIKTTILKDDDGWVVPEEKVVDYSGLRIQDLSVAEAETVQQPEDEEDSTPANAGKKSWVASDKPAGGANLSSFAFPTLDQSVGDVGVPPPPGMKNFKAVRNGYKGDGPNRTGEKVQLTNRFGALE